jgi:hypothetical protein
MKLPCSIRGANPSGVRWAWGICEKTMAGVFSGRLVRMSGKITVLAFDVNETLLEIEPLIPAAGPCNAPLPEVGGQDRRRGRRS